MKILLSLVLILVLANCTESTTNTPEDRVKATLVALEVAAEKRSLSDFMEHFSDDYHDHLGNTADRVRLLVQLQYMRNHTIHILSKIQSLTIEGDTALVEISAAMAAREADLDGEASGLRADTHHFSVVLSSPDDQQTWLIESASWDRGWGSH